MSILASGVRFRRPGSWDTETTDFPIWQKRLPRPRVRAHGWRIGPIVSAGARVTSIRSSTSSGCCAASRKRSRAQIPRAAAAHACAKLKPAPTEFCPASATISRGAGAEVEGRAGFQSIGVVRCSGHYTLRLSA